MERKREPYPVSTLCELKENIDTNPDYQRPAVWKTSNKQLLIDTILRYFLFKQTFQHETIDL